MANLRISDLIQRTPDGTEFLEVIIPPFTSGTNRKVLLSDLVGLNEHFRGVYVSLVALQTAVPVGIVGDYADVDTGIGSNAVRYLWDVNDAAWIAGGSVVPDATSSTKGIAKLYTTTGSNTDGSMDQNSITNAINSASIGAKSFKVEVTDEVTNIGAGTNKRTFRMPYAMTLTAVRCELLVAQASGSIFTVDINETGTSILSTKLTIDNTETTSVTAAIPAVISDASLADDAVITIDVDQIGDGSAIGLKITLIGS